MTGRAARFNWLRWSAVFLLNLLWATTGGASALAEQGDFDRSLIAANSGGRLVHMSGAADDIFASGKLGLPSNNCGPGCKCRS
jgi:hypothetical protein